MAISKTRARRTLVAWIGELSEELADFERTEIPKWRAMEMGIAGFVRRAPEDPKTAHLKLDVLQLKDAMRKLRKIHRALAKRTREAGAEVAKPNVSWSEVSRSIKAQTKLLAQLIREREWLLNRITGRSGRRAAHAAKKSPATK